MYCMSLTLGRQVMYTRSSGDHLAATITGPSQNGDQYLAIRYLRHGAYVEHTCALVTSIERPIRTPSPLVRSPSPSRSRSRSPPNHVCRYHVVEGRLCKWILARRKCHVLVTKKMLIRKAKEICPNLRALTPAQLEDW